MKRSPEEIITRIKEIAAKNSDFFGVQIGRLIERLDYADAKPLLRPEVKEEEWEKTTTPIKDEVHEYLKFAWDKANNRRGLSANRSIDHFRGLLWLDGHDDIDAVMDEMYEFYGKPNLVYISELYDFPWKDHDDGKWSNDETSDIDSEVRDERIAHAVSSAEKYKERLTYEA